MRIENFKDSSESSCELTTPGLPVNRRTPLGRGIYTHAYALAVEVRCRLNAGRLGSDYAEQGQLGREGRSAWRVRVAVEDRFYSQNRFTAADTTTIGSGVGDLVAVSQ